MTKTTSLHTPVRRAGGFVRLALVLLSSLLLATPLAACNDDDASATAEAATAKKGGAPGGGGGGGGGARGPMGPRAVRVELSERGPLSLEVEFIGEVLARNLVELAPRDAGLLIELDVDEGDRVTAGQVVARLDDARQDRARTEARRRVESDKARLEQQRAQLEATKREIERRRPLVERQAVPGVELDRLEDELAVLEQGVAVAQAQYTESRAAVTSSGTELDRRELVAPFDGVVVERHVTRGATVSPSSPIVTLVDDTSLVFETRMSETRSARLHVGQPARVRLDALPERELDAHVVRVGQTVDRESRTIAVELKIDVDPETPALRHGMFGRGHLAVRSLDDVVHVPLDAVERNARVPGEKATVWTVTADDIVHEREVEVLLVNERRVALAGLEAGERVVVSGSRGLEDGSAVAVATALDAAAGASGDAPDTPEKKKNEKPATGSKP